MTIWKKNTPDILPTSVDALFLTSAIGLKMQKSFKKLEIPENSNYLSFLKETLPISELQMWPNFEVL